MVSLAGTMDANETQIADDSRSVLPREWGTPAGFSKIASQKRRMSKMMNRVLHKSVKMLKECYNTRIRHVSTTGQKKFRQMHFLGRLAPPYPK